MRVLITARAAAGDGLFVVDCDPLTSISELVDKLAARVGAPPNAIISVDGRIVARLGLVGESGLMDGSIMEFGDVGAADREPEGSVDLFIAGGMGTGATVRLGAGETIVQVDQTGRLLVGEPAISGVAVAVMVSVDGSVRVRQATESRTSVGGVQTDSQDHPLGESFTEWEMGAQLTIARSVLGVQRAARPDADLRPSSEPGRLDYNRPPRLLPPMPTTKYRLPAAPTAPPRSPLPWLAAAMPAVLGIAMASVFQSPSFLLLSLATPLMAIGNWYVARRNGAKSHRSRVQDHKAERALLESEVQDSVRHEQHRRRTTSPGPSELLLIATTPTRRLWERRRTDPDHLEVRLGLADLSSSVEIDDLAAPEHLRRSASFMTGVPVTVSLQESGVVGIAGPADWPRQRASWIVGQLGVLQSPRDVQIYILASSDSADDWAWAAWFPHLRPASVHDAVALLGITAETIAFRVSELAALIAERTAVRADMSSRAVTFTPDVVVILDGARRLRALPGVVSILRDGPAVGVRVICLDTDEQLLPEECTALVLARPDGGMLLRRHNADNIDGIRVDDVSAHFYLVVPRSIAAVVDVTASESEGLIPDSARLVEVLAIEDADAEAIAAQWQVSRGTTEAVVGVSIDGPFALDLVRDGPHALVAGTTGSGKSEFLQSVIASLAVANTPETMTFVLVDYKGGAAFSQCALLPHTVGMVTDLDSHLVERALNSLKAELGYREQILGAAEAKDLEDYLEAQRKGHMGPTLPRLAIIIDEFAAMAKELPDFVSGLVGIAQRGRSLGIHLVLATQRPSGVISAEIRANTNLRIALRMTDKSESSDVIDAPDAARITKAQPGRAFARLGHAALFPFQTARVGGRRLSRRETLQIEPTFITRLSAADLGGPVPRKPTPQQGVADNTDLSALVATLVAANELCGFAPPRSPWLPPLQNLISLDALDAPISPTAFAWGQEDEPLSQRQRPAVIDLEDFGHMYVVGAPGSGRSTVLRTIAMSAVSRLPVNDLHLYAIDCGSGALAVLDELPHTGAVVQRSQADRAVRLLTRLKAELAQRQQVLARGNYANITEQREHESAAESLPHVLLLIDRWESFVTSFGDLDGGALMETMQELLRDGASAGIHVVVAGDRTLLSSRMSVLTDDMLILRLTDRVDFGMAGVNHRILPEEIPVGRGFRSGSGREVQTAILGVDSSGRGQTAAVRKISPVLKTASQLGDQRPFRVDDLPSTIDLEASYAYAGPEADKPMWAMLGIGGDQLSALGMDLANDAPTFIVAGPARSGRSSMLMIMAESMLRTGTQLVVAAPRMSPLRKLEGREGVRAVFTGTEITDDDLGPVLDPDGEPVVFIVDDAELLTDLPAKSWLRSFVRTAADNRRALVIAGDASQVAGGFSGWQVDAKKNRRGALLSPQSQLDGDLVGVRLPRSSTSSQIVPGRALVHLGSGQFNTILVPTL